VNYQLSKTNIDFCSKVLQFTTISFDVCFQEIFSTLLAGGELHIASKEIKMDALKLIRFIYDSRLNIIFIPPTYLKIIINEKLLDLLPRTIKHIIVAGEQLIITGQLKIYLQRAQSVFT